MGKVTTGCADDQWQNITRRRTVQNKKKRRRRRRSVPRRVVFRKPLPRDRREDSTPMMVADFVFRKQIEWLVDNTGVRDDFKDVAHKIWFRYGKMNSSSPQLSSAKMGNLTSRQRR